MYDIVRSNHYISTNFSRKGVLKNTTDEGESGVDLGDGDEGVDDGSC
jgi:hypothetical protein